MFQKLQKKIKEFFGEKGQGTVEYALLLGVVALIALSLLNDEGLGDKVTGSVNKVGTSLDKVGDTVTAAANGVSVPDGVKAGG